MNLTLLGTRRLQKVVRIFNFDNIKKKESCKESCKETFVVRNPDEDFFESRKVITSDMNVQLTKTQFYEVLRTVEETDSWRPNGKHQGIQAQQLLQKFRSKGGRVPPKNHKRYAPHQNAKVEVKEKHNFHMNEFRVEF